MTSETFKPKVTWYGIASALVCVVIGLYYLNLFVELTSQPEPQPLNLYFGLVGAACLLSAIFLAVGLRGRTWLVLATALLVTLQLVYVVLAFFAPSLVGTTRGYYFADILGGLFQIFVAMLLAMPLWLILGVLHPPKWFGGKSDATTPPEKRGNSFRVVCMVIIGACLGLGVLVGQFTPQSLGINALRYLSRPSLETVQSNWKPVLQDWSPENPNGWQVGAYTERSAKGTRTILGNVYHWETDAGGTAQPTHAPVRDFYASVRARRVQGQGGYGLVLHRVEDKVDYYFSLEGDQYNVQYVNPVGGDGYPIADAAPNLIQVDGENKLSVLAQDTLLTFFINDKSVGQVVAKSPGPWNVGLNVGEGTFEFRDMQLVVDPAQAASVAMPFAAATPTGNAVPTLTPLTRTEIGTLVPESAAWDMTLYDGFDSNDHFWYTDFDQAITDSKYVWDLKRPVNIYRGLPEGAEVGDFAASVDARHTAGSKDCGYGITFRNSEGEGEYVFVIHDDGRWGFDIIHSPDPGIAQKGVSEAITQGGVNRITVGAVGGQLKFFINQTLVGETEDETLARGRVGTAVWVLGKADGCTIEFDNFQLVASSAPPVTRTPNPTPNVAVEFPHQIVTGYDTENRAQFPTGAYAEPPLSGKREIKDGSYRWEMLAPSQQIEQFAIPMMDAVSDFTASVTLKRVEGPDRAWAGLVFRQTDSNHYYIFKLTNFDSYAFTVQDGDDYNSLIFPTSSDAIKAGEANELRVVANGPQFDLYINDQLVDKVTNSQLASGKVGLAAMVYEPGATGIYEFRDFEVRAP